MIHIRNIQPDDDAKLANIIRSALVEFHANKPGTVYYDESTDHLSDLFCAAGSIYFVAEIDGIVAGGAGVFPTEGLPEGTSELVKMYLSPEGRGKGLGGELINRCIDYAKNKGDHAIYLETLPELHLAVNVYRKLGFEFLNQPLGDSKHTGCSLWMLKKI